MSKNKIVVVFIGPQGAGKSYHAQKILKSSIINIINSILVSLNYHALLHVKFTEIIDSIICKILDSCISAKFYLNKPKMTLGSPQIYNAFFPIFYLIHFLAFIISELCISLLMLTNDLIIDQEGYVFKQIADLHYLARYARISDKSLIWKALRKLYLLLLLMAMKKNLVIFHLEVEYSELIRRYKKRDLIESPYYINTQKFVYNAISSIIKSCNIRNVLIHEVHTRGQKDQVNKLIISKLEQDLLRWL